MATYKLDNDMNMIPMDQWQAAQAQRQRHAEIVQYIEPDPADILPGYETDLTQKSMIPHSATSHQVTERTDPERQAKGFLIAYGLGIIPLYAFLSAGIVWVASGTFLAGWFLLLMGLMSSVTWLWAQKNNLNHSGAGIRRHEVTQQAALMSRAADQSFELAKLKMRQDHQYRREALHAKIKALRG